MPSSVLVVLVSRNQSCRFKRQGIGREGEKKRDNECLQKTKSESSTKEIPYEASRHITFHTTTKGKFGKFRENAAFT